jgi:hypothetical protein
MPWKSLLSPFSLLSADILFPGTSAILQSWILSKAGHEVAGLRAGKRRDLNPFESSDRRKE